MAEAGFSSPLDAQRLDLGPCLTVGPAAGDRQKEESAGGDTVEHGLEFDRLGIPRRRLLTRFTL